MTMRSRLPKFGFLLASFSMFGADTADQAINLGMVKIRSNYGRYLQAKSDGEIHASQEEDHIGSEETWFLIKVSTPDNQVYYTFQSWKTHKFLRKIRDSSEGCVVAAAESIGPDEEWSLVKSNVVIGGAKAFKSRRDNTFLGANDPGNNTLCGGEVAAKGNTGPPMDSSDSPAWFHVDPTTEPEENGGFWHSVTSVFGVVVKLAPIAAEVLAAL